MDCTFSTLLCVLIKINTNILSLFAVSTHIFCDNETVVNKCSKIESVLNKIHSSVAYHMARRAVAAGEVSVGWINREYKLSDALTKRLSKATRQSLFWDWTY